MSPWLLIIVGLFKQVGGGAVGWLTSNLRVVGIVVAAVLLVGAGCVIAEHRQQAKDAALKEAIIQVKTLQDSLAASIALNKQVTIESQARKDSISVTKAKADSAKAESKKAHAIADNAKRALARDSTMRDSLRDALAIIVADSLYSVADSARAHEDSLTIVRLTHDRDSWEGQAHHADSLAQVGQAAIANLVKSAESEHCTIGPKFLGISCPSRTKVGVIAFVAGTVTGSVVTATLKKGAP